MWEQITNGIDWFFNKPLPIVGVSLFIVCIFAWKIFKSSSFGKKKYNQMKLKVEGLELVCKTTLDNAKKKVEDIEKESNAKIEALKTFYETSLAQKQAKEDELEALLLSVCNNIHNEKIKGAVSDYLGKTQSQKTIMTTKIEEVKSSYEDRIKKLEDMLYGKEEELDSSKEE